MNLYRQFEAQSRDQIVCKQCSRNDKQLTQCWISSRNQSSQTVVSCSQKLNISPSKADRKCPDKIVSAQIEMSQTREDAKQRVDRPRQQVIAQIHILQSKVGEDDRSGIVWMEFYVSRELVV